MNKLTATVEQAMQIILGCDEDKLVRTKQIQEKMQSWYDDNHSCGQNIFLIIQDK